MANTVTETEDELHRRRKLEEALEVKSLRRIIGAYLNYHEASEEDIRRYERSFNRLPPAHKALLSHLPMKFQNLRRCITKNSYFIFSMLQAFEPPLDLSQDIDTCEHRDLKNVPDCNEIIDEENVSSSQSASTSGRASVIKPNQDHELVHVNNGSNISLHSAASQCNNCISENLDGGSLKISNNDATVDSAVDPNGNASPAHTDWLDSSFKMHVPLVDVDKVRCVIRNIVRDWAAEGQKERDQCFKPILEELEAQFPDRRKGSPPACLVPGAGLGRLALEISSLGFISQGNEFSYYMMICSSFILNHAETAEEWTIYPWIHTNCNSLSDSDQLRPVTVPDIHPASAGITEGFSMCGGDFVEVYSDRSQVGFVMYGTLIFSMVAAFCGNLNYIGNIGSGKRSLFFAGMWDAVVTCFFLDTAHNIVEYIEIISNILKDGGVWINLGPLLYHFADMYGHEDEMSVELSLEDVKRVALHYGFQIEKENMIETTYTTNPRSMMQNRYFTAFWTMRKKRASTEAVEQGTP